MKTIVITGASDGIGAYSAKQLKSLGHNVIIVGRNKQKTVNLASEINCPYHLADFSKISDVYRLIEELNAYPTIDVLVNNAGAVMGERTETENGIEKRRRKALAAWLLGRPAPLQNAWPRSRTCVTGWYLI